MSGFWDTRTCIYIKALMYLKAVCSQCCWRMMGAVERHAFQWLIQSSLLHFHMNVGQPRVTPIAPWTQASPGSSQTQETWATERSPKSQAHKTWVAVKAEKVRRWFRGWLFPTRSCHLQSTFYCTATRRTTNHPWPSPWSYCVWLVGCSHTSTALDQLRKISLKRSSVRTAHGPVIFNIWKDEMKTTKSYQVYQTSQDRWSHMPSGHLYKNDFHDLTPWKELFWD